MGALRNVGKSANSDDAVLDRADADARYILISTYNNGMANKVNNASGQSLTLWKGTQSQYDAIGTKDANTIYVITT